LSERNLSGTSLETLVSLCKRRGFIFQSSEIYGGLSSVWDYGPVGSELKRNVKNAWWKNMVSDQENIVGLDASILMHPNVWKASGHLENFSDPLVECSITGKRYREDHIFILELKSDNKNKIVSIEAGDIDEAKKITKEQIISITPLPQSNLEENPSPNGGILSEPRQFNLMFKTFLGAMEDSSSEVYLRPETAQAMFVNFENVINSSRKKIPFGIAQIGKSFRNEITPGNFTYRTREFEQMEMEFFCEPGTDEKWHEHWIKFSFDWFNKYGIRKENLKVRYHDKDELPHYSKASADIEYLFPWGWGELETISNRTDYDLIAHSKLSGKNLSYFDENQKKRYTPFVVEPAMGADRSALAFLSDAYDEEGKDKDKRVVLRFHPDIAPNKVAVLPLSRNEKLTPTARKIYENISKKYNAEYDDTQSIGKRYRRQDEIGTPVCITVDFDTVENDNCVTIRNRDTMDQIRVKIDSIDKNVNNVLEQISKNSSNS